MNFTIGCMFYAVVHTTKDNINITIKLKLSEIKIIETKDKILSLFQVEVEKPKRQFAYIQKYPTGKKKAMGKIMQIFNK